MKRSAMARQSKKRIAAILSGEYDTERTEKMRTASRQPTKRHARIRPFGDVRRAAERFAAQFCSDEYVQWSHLQPSVVSSEIPTVCAHTKSRAAGGTYLDIVPLTAAEHNEWHLRGRRFWADRGLDPDAVQQLAAEHYERWMSYCEAWI